MRHKRTISRRRFSLAASTYAPTFTRGERLHSALRATIMPWRDRANHAKVVSMAEAFICDKSSNRAWAFWIAKEIEALDHTPLVHKWSASTPPIRFSAWCQTNT